MRKKFGGPRFEEAVLYALRLHARQLRKGSEIPYVAHLLAVVSLVLEDGGGEDEAIAALLHDAVEDQGGRATREEIRRRFGERVARIVDGCTDADVVPKPPWRERKERYIRTLPAASPEVVRVETADKLHNARSVLRDYRRIGEELWTRFTGGRDGTLWYYREISRALAAAGGGEMGEELVRVVDEIVLLAEAAE